jgi:hypothetical protein
VHGGCQALGRFGEHHTRRTGNVAKRAIQSGAIILCRRVKNHVTIQFALKQSQVDNLQLSAFGGTLMMIVLRMLRLGTRKIVLSIISPR